MPYLPPDHMVFPQQIDSKIHSMKDKKLPERLFTREIEQNRQLPQ